MCVVIKKKIEFTIEHNINSKTVDRTAKGNTVHPAVDFMAGLFVVWYNPMSIMSMLSSLYLSDNNESDVNVPITDVCTMQTLQTELEQVQGELLALKT